MSAARRSSPRLAHASPTLNDFPIYKILIGEAKYNTCIIKKERDIELRYELLGDPIMFDINTVCPNVQFSRNNTVCIQAAVRKEYYTSSLSEIIQPVSKEITSDNVKNFPKIIKEIQNFNNHLNRETNFIESINEHEREIILDNFIQYLNVEGKKIFVSTLLPYQLMIEYVKSKITFPNLRSPFFVKNETEFPSRPFFDDDEEKDFSAITLYLTKVADEKLIEFQAERDEALLKKIKVETQENRIDRVKQEIREKYTNNPDQIIDYGTNPLYVQAKTIEEEFVLPNDEEYKRLKFMNDRLQDSIRRLNVKIANEQESIKKKNGQQ